MKRTITLTLTLALIALVGHAQQTKPITWQVDTLKTIGKHPVTVIGGPTVIAVPGGKAVMFDGVDDGLLLNDNPIAGARAFTIEAIFRPDPGGSKEQRWFHLQEANSENRVLLETRLVGDQWFLDTFIKSGDNSRALLAENFKHPLGDWYHVALVYDGTQMRHYVNGVEELAGPLTIAPLNQGQTSIGVRMNRVYWFKGAIRKARFTLKALAPGEFMKK
jgi:Concanavalin A-like lectin/glucanases superfamily